jgi:hypothetical protein
MSTGRIWDEYEKIAEEKGFIKKADKSNPAYDIIPPAPGADVKVEHDGWELTELAHPNPVQVSLSQSNDGVVENGVEQQKAMIDVAVRSPRGIIAELVEVLVKVANELDKDMTNDAMKLASEVDILIVKLAQAEYNRTRQLWLAGTETLDALRAIQFPFWGSKLKDLVEQAIANLERIELDAKADGLNAKLMAQLAFWATSNYKELHDELGTWWQAGSSGGERAMLALGELYRDATNYIKSIQTQPSVAPQTQEGYGVLKHDQQATPPGLARTEEQHAAPASGHHNWNTKLDATKVEELQRELGMTGHIVDGKFGPNTYLWVMNEAKQNANLRTWLQNSQHYAQSYMNWDDAALDAATRYVKQQKEQYSMKPKFDPSTGLIDTYSVKEKSPANKAPQQMAFAPSKLNE